MKLVFLARHDRSFFVHTIAAGLLMVASLSTHGADPKPEELRQRVAQLQQKADDLKSAGREEEANKLMREVEELRDQFQRFDPGLREADRKQRLQELNRELDVLKDELKELRANGRTDEAAEVNEKVSRLEQELDRIRAGRGVDRDGLRGLRPRRERPPRIERDRGNLRPPVGGQPPPPESQEMSNRLRHLHAAIDNLHAAGLHEIAEHLTQEAEKMRGQLRDAPAQPPRPRGPRPLEGELAPLRQEIQELRRAVQELRREVEELRPRQP